MAGKIFFKIWSIFLSSLAISASDTIATINQEQDKHTNDETQISIRQSNKSDLFLQKAKDFYGNLMDFAAHRSHSSHRSHRSHSSHRSHYSSSTYSPPSTSTTSPPESQGITPSTPVPAPSLEQQGIQPPKSYTPKTSVPQGTTGVPKTGLKSYMLNITDVKMIQVSLNLLGFNTGRVDGNFDNATKSAIAEFQNSLKLNVSGHIDGQTCLNLARKIRDSFPDDPKSKEIHDHLLRLYLNMATQ